MNPLWDIVQAHLDKYGVREAELSRRIGASSPTLNQWKNRGVKGLPQKRLLLALARETGTSYEAVLDAALRSIGYLPEEAGEEHAERSAPTKAAGRTPAQDDYDRAARRGTPAHQPDAVTGEENQDPGGFETA